MTKSKIFFAKMKGSETNFSLVSIRNGLESVLRSKFLFLLFLGKNSLFSQKSQVSQFIGFKNCESCENCDFRNFANNSIWFSEGHRNFANNTIRFQDYLEPCNRVPVSHSILAKREKYNSRS